MTSCARWDKRPREVQAELSEVFKAKTQESQLSQTSTVNEHWTFLRTTSCRLQKKYVVFPGITMDYKTDINESPRGKTNNVVSDQVQHKPACTSTEKS